jgi:phenylalanyl-tRNA synthetase alpha chain
MEREERLKELLAERPDMATTAEDALAAVEECATLAQVEEARIHLLGKKGKVTAIFKGLGGATPEERRSLGELGNLLRALAEDRLKAKEQALSRLEQEARLRGRAIDVTLPGRRAQLGHEHLITQVIDEVVSIFVSLGYRVETGPEVELDYYNFEALNTPAYHPARSLNDTFYVLRHDIVHDNRDDILLRAHTSPVQVRVMEAEKPPLYVVSPGKAYRRDEIDATHSPMFFQVEGFAVDRVIDMGDLKGTLEVFAKKLFGEDRKVRFRPHFFPFTEPSAELDVSCFVCDAEGCPLCKGVGWLEILGCGMIDPNVFEHVGYDPEEYSGFAFGMGIERIAMMKYGIEDLRVFYENDVRFLKQF